MSPHCGCCCSGTRVRALGHCGAGSGCVCRLCAGSPPAAHPRRRRADRNRHRASRAFRGAGVGKTCFMLRFAEDTFQRSFITTVGVDYKHKHVTIDGKRIRLAVCGDCAGQVPRKSARGACGPPDSERPPRASRPSPSRSRSGTRRGRSDSGQSRARICVALRSAWRRRRFRTVRSSGFADRSPPPRPQGILLMYDVTDRRSFNHVHRWMQQIEQVRHVAHGRRRGGWRIRPCDRAPSVRRL